MKAKEGAAMTKSEFLSQLEYRLRILPENERRDAVEYYEGYIDDAAEDEASAIERLGPPAEVAAKIIAEIAVSGGSPYAAAGDEARENAGDGARESAGEGARENVEDDYRAYSGEMPRFYAGNGERVREPEPAKKRGLSMAWTVILAIFAVPIGLPLAVAAASVAFAMLVVMLSLLVAFGATAFGLVVGGAASAVVGILALFQNLPLAAMILGVALSSLGFGLLFTKLTVVMAESGFRAIARFAGKVIIRRSKNV